MSKSKLKFLLLLVALAISLISFNFANADAKVTSFNRYILPGKAIFPEGVAYQPKTNNFFVGGTKDGTIFQGNLQQESAHVFLPGGSDERTTVTGLHLDNHKNRLFVAGGMSGQVFVYNSHSGKLLSKFNNQKDFTFINDVTVTANGDAYFTDSFDPTLYKISTNKANEMEFSAWLDLTDTDIVYQTGFNLNGIDTSIDGKYLVVIQTNTGKLFRIDINSKQVTEITLDGERLVNGDGVLLTNRQTLYVVRNKQNLIVKILLSDDFSRGIVVSSMTDPSFNFPTTITQAEKRLLVVNLQLEKRDSPDLLPDLPFTVSSVSLP